MATALTTTLPPMEAESVDILPEGPDWQYEPKWDGFRCIAFRAGNEIQLQSKSEKTLGRYFPEIVAALEAIPAKKFVLDGEIAVPVAGRFQFDELLQRIHPAQSRITKLSTEHPAIYVVFDLLLGPRGRSLLPLPLSQRRPLLEAFAKKNFTHNHALRLSPATTRLSEANEWLQSAGADLDGVVAKRLDKPYTPGERTMVKVKPVRSADCVVGGFRYLERDKHLVGSLLLGLYDEEGLLHHVGFTSSFRHTDRAELTKKLERLRKPPGFTGRAPGGPSRWSTKRSSEWEPVQPKLVVEVSYDQFSAGRFRHGTSLLRWRPDKAPRQCTFGQINRGGANVQALEL